MHLDKSFVALWLLSLSVSVGGLPPHVTVTPTGVPSGFVDEVAVSGLTSPTSVAFAPDGRIVIGEQRGDFKVFQANGTLLATTHIAVNFPSTQPNERGLLGVELDSGFASNRFAYVYYTRIPSGQPADSNAATGDRLSRFTLSGSALDLASEMTLLDNVPEPSTVHNSGDMHIGGDGKLWLSTGDGGDSSTAPDINSLNGKILRLNLDGSAPSDNPFYEGTDGARDYVWARGFRNPWRFNFEPGTDTPFIGDVGEARWEELDIGQRGADYGWPAYEGEQVYLGPENYPFTHPLYTYSHVNNACAIIGGDFVTGFNWPADYQDNYFFADWCMGTLWRVVLNGNNSIASLATWATGLATPTTIKHGRDGFLYYLTYTSGELHRIRWLDAPVLNKFVRLPLIRQ